MSSKRKEITYDHAVTVMAPSVPCWDPPAKECQLDHVRWHEEKVLASARQGRGDQLGLEVFQPALTASDALFRVQVVVCGLVDPAALLPTTPRTATRA